VTAPTWEWVAVGLYAALAITLLAYIWHWGHKEKRYQEKKRAEGNPYYTDDMRVWGGKRWKRKHPYVVASSIDREEAP